MREMISVIVPAYNVERYIEGCLESVINQTYEDIELVIVDDGSTDQTLDVIKLFIEKHIEKNIKLISQNNQGVSSARNRALSVAEGEFIVFLDSDDSLCRNYVEVLIDTVKKTNADIVLCAPKMVNSIEARDREAMRKNIDSHASQEFKAEDVLKQLLLQRIPGSSCEKIFRKKCLENIEFPVGIKNNEDKLFLYRAIKQSKRVSILSAEMYICLERKGSATRTNDHFNTDSILVAEQILQDIQATGNYKDMEILAYYHLYSMTMYNLRTLMRTKLRSDEKKNTYRFLSERINRMDCFHIFLRYSKMYAVEWGVVMLGYRTYAFFVWLCDKIFGN